MSLKSLSIVAAAALALCAGAAQAASQNAFANGSFETIGVPPQIAEGWRGFNGIPAVRSNAEARTGSWSALLSLPNGFNGSGLVQDTLDDGGMPEIDPSNWGTTTTLSFWTKGRLGETGAIDYSLRFLDAGSNILGPQFNGQFNNKVTDSWTEVSAANLLIPTNTAAAILLVTYAAGPSAGMVYIDDVSLSVAAIPEPSTYALMLAGLAGVGLLAKRRRQA
jgi:hypothetical protein